MAFFSSSMRVTPALFSCAALIKECSTHFWKSCIIQPIRWWPKGFPILCALCRVSTRSVRLKEISVFPTRNCDALEPFMWVRLINTIFPTGLECTKCLDPEDLELFCVPVCWEVQQGLHCVFTLTVFSTTLRLRPASRLQTTWFQSECHSYPLFLLKSLSSVTGLSRKEDGWQTKWLALTFLSHSLSHEAFRNKKYMST